MFKMCPRLTMENFILFCLATGEIFTLDLADTNPSNILNYNGKLCELEREKISRMRTFILGKCLNPEINGSASFLF
jgi:hypothetical protein